MARHKLSKEQQIKGLRKALKNPRTPKQFLAGMKKRLARLTAVVILALIVPALAHAQFIGYTSPQSVQQTLASAQACSGSLQTFNVINLGQTEHFLTFIPSTATGIQTLDVAIYGVDKSGNATKLSDDLVQSNSSAPTGSINGSGYYPIVQAQVICSGSGTYTLNYSGVSSTPDGVKGGYKTAQILKVPLNGIPLGSGTNSQNFTTPFGSTAGQLVFTATGAPPAGSSVFVSCISPSPLGQTFNLTAAVTQEFAVGGFPCDQAALSFLSGGASANTGTISYVFNVPGTPVTTSALALNAAINSAPIMAEKGARWAIFNNPSTGSQAQAIKAAGGAGVYHVADCLSFAAGSTAAPAATFLNVTIISGASTLYNQVIAIPASAGQNTPPFAICGLNVIGLANTSMIAQWSVGLANLQESVSLSGYDVQ